MKLAANRCLKNKKVLITSGPTWVAIDRVRVISNCATGETGIALARSFHEQGARVTLLLGPVGECALPKGVRLVRFKFYHELASVLKKDLTQQRYDMIVHSAAVSDFAPRAAVEAKVSSTRAMQLVLYPLPKLLDLVVRLQRKATVVMFKFEPGVSDRELIKDAMQARERSGAQYVVANRLDPYRAFILGACGVREEVTSKKALVQALVKLAGVYS